MQVRYLLVMGLLAVSAGGCAPVRRLVPGGRLALNERTGGSAAIYAQFRAYDGHSGRPLSFGQVVARLRSADVICFGEQHSDAVCNQLEAQLLYALTRQRRPIALAMEFFEGDTQAALDAYLAGRLDEPDFRKQARQGRAYVLAHRPLIEMCRGAHVPVLAANAPRRLVRAYRTSGLEYEEFRRGLPPEDQRWLPPQNAYLPGAYQERFFETMSGHDGDGSPAAGRPAGMPTTPGGMPPTPGSDGQRPPAAMPGGAAGMPLETKPGAAGAADTQPGAVSPGPPTSRPGLDRESMYRAQLLWDESMADALARHRGRYPSYRVMLIVGSFHVAAEGGTVQKFRQRRPGDRVVTIVYNGTTDSALPLDAEQRGGGDIVITGLQPPPEPKEAGMPRGPATRPAEMPAATHPAGSQPPTQPVSPPAEMPPATHPAGMQTPAVAPVGMAPASQPQIPAGPEVRENGHSAVVNR